MPTPQRRGVHKVSEDIMAEGRTIIVTDTNGDNIKDIWSRLPAGTVNIDPSTGAARVKKQGGTTWEPMVIDKVSEDIQKAIDDVNGFNGRLNQMEVTQANILMKMEADKTVPESNLMLVEDFADTSSIDTTAIQITNINRNLDVVTVARIDGIYVGSEYTISDGISQEKVHIKAIIKNGDNRTIQLQEIVKNTYVPKQVYLYRTTAKINVTTKKCFGAGDKRIAAWKPATEWHGSGATVENKISLDTSQKNASSFTQTGSVGFTADGQFTIAL